MHAAHDHSSCIRAAVEAAEQVCETKNIRLTPLRRRVLEIVWRQHDPIGAYQILAEIAKDRAKAAPPTVYRALEFLLGAGLVHRVDALNAYVGCDRPHAVHAGQFLVCPGCRKVTEIDDPRLMAGLERRANALGYRLEGSIVEIKARCAECARTPE
jgi:Fur family zinc uptake transcriptional regulator